MERLACVVADVPGVGRNLQNHPGVDLQFATRHEDSLTAQLTLAGRAKLGAEYHPSGTCRMGTDADAVVDSEGRLNAVPGLRVADASIMPRVITGNLNAPVIMMAEKISDRILGRQPLPPSDAMYHRPRVS